MKGIKLFAITYEDGGVRAVKEWPAQNPDHAVKRFQRARALSNQQPAKLISVHEVRAR